MFDTASVILTALVARALARRWRGPRPGLAALLAALGGGGMTALLLPADPSPAAEATRAIFASAAAACGGALAALLTPSGAR